MTYSAPQWKSFWPHRLAVLLVCATVPLIWVGGLVTTYDAGMAVPDWPGTYGYNLFLYPWQTWVFGPWNVFIEHGHRLLGATVGIITIAFVVVVFTLDRRGWLKLAALAALALVIAQGVLGGFRVLLDQRQLALAHGCLGPAFFALAVGLAAFTSQWWKDTAQAIAHEKAPRLHLLSAFTAMLAFAQLVIGAHLRHLPHEAGPNFFRAMLLFHLLVAALLAGHAIALVIVVLHRHSQGALLGPALALVLLVSVQIALGASTFVVKYGWPDWFSDMGFAEAYTVQARSLVQSHTVTAHVATGSLILATSVLLTLRSLRLVPASAKRSPSFAATVWGLAA